MISTGHLRGPARFSFSSSSLLICNLCIFSEGFIYRHANRYVLACTHRCAHTYTRTRGRERHIHTHMRERGTHSHRCTHISPFHPGILGQPLMLHWVRVFCGHDSWLCYPVFCYLRLQNCAWAEFILGKYFQVKTNAGCF